MMTPIFFPLQNQGPNRTECKSSKNKYFSPTFTSFAQIHVAVYKIEICYSLMVHSVIMFMEITCFHNKENNHFLLIGN